MDFLNRDFYKKLKFETETPDSEGKQFRTVNKFDIVVDKVISIDEAFSILENSDNVCCLYRDGGSCVVHTIDTTVVFPYSYNTFGRNYQAFNKPYAGYKKYENSENEKYLEMLELQRKEDERKR